MVCRKSYHYRMNQSYRLDVITNKTGIVLSFLNKQ